ncbi:glycine cleavage system H protein, mitochondrial [Diutina catenulata]
MFKVATRSAFRPMASAFRTMPVRSIAITAPRFNNVSYELNTKSELYKYKDEGPTAVKFTAEHEWIAVFNDQSAFVGITQYAAEALGDVTFCELPEVGETVEVGDTIGSVESVKSSSDIYAPVAGEIINANTTLDSEPGVLNIDPMGNGWIAHIKLSDPSAIESDSQLLSKEEYEASLEDH